MQLANPQYLWLLLIIIPLTIHYILGRRKANPSLNISSLSPFKNTPTPLRARLRHLLFILRMLAIATLIIILARPQTKDNWQTTTTQGTDIILALDISSSMKARDFDPDRLQAAKQLSKQFIAGRDGDNIGIVIFAGEALTGIPMTTDHDALNHYIDAIDLGMIDDGTAIGDGIATAVNRLTTGRAKSKSIILLTDGSNNTGTITPSDAATIAKNKKIRIYTIAVGTRGKALAPAYLDAMGNIQYQLQDVIIDETTLQNIARQTNGQYFRATDNKTLKNIFNQIDKLEKTKIDISRYSHTDDNYTPWAWLLIGLILFELTLRYTILRTNP